MRHITEAKYDLLKWGLAVVAVSRRALRLS